MPIAVYFSSIKLVRSLGVMPKCGWYGSRCYWLVRGCLDYEERMARSTGVEPTSLSIETCSEPRLVLELAWEIALRARGSTWTPWRALFSIDTSLFFTVLCAVVSWRSWLFLNLFTWTWSRVPLFVSKCNLLKAVLELLTELLSLSVFNSIELVVSPRFWSSLTIRVKFWELFSSMLRLFGYSILPYSSELRLGWFEAWPSTPTIAV